MNGHALQSDIGIIHAHLIRMRRRLHVRLHEACRRLDTRTAMQTVSEAISVAEATDAVRRVIGRMQTSAPVPTYLLSSLTVREASAVLTTSEDEDLRFATGFAVAPVTYAVTRLLQFELKRKSVVGAEGEQESVARLLIGLYNADHKLLMTWHSHPGRGPASTAPSSTDLDFHRRLEAGNYPTIGAIVNRDGFVRFFSCRRRFKVTVYGKGMEVVDENSCVYKLDSLGAL
jgi:proteasome lid subunit RPN8/RPN11